MAHTRTMMTAVALLALTGGALALAQPDRARQAGQRDAQPGQSAGQPGQRGGQPGQRGGDPAQFVERMMQRDANGDGKLQRDELPEQLAERLFESGDTNGDGALDREELLAVMSRRTGQGGGQGGRQGEANAAPNFEGSMRQAGRALTGLQRAELTSDSMQRDLRSVQMLQQALLGAKGGMSSAPRSERAQERFNTDDKFNMAMRMNILRALSESITLEMAILDGKEGAAKESIAKITEIQTKAHDVFQPEHEDDDEDGAPGDDAGRGRGGGRSGGRRGGGG